MTLTVGRATFDNPPEQADLQGDRLTLSGRLQPAEADTDLLRVTRQQLLGYLGNTDEDVVPLTFDDDPTLDGFYRVSDASCANARAVDLSGVLAWSASLERVAGGYSSAIVEVIAEAFVMTNAHSVTNPTGFWGPPSAAKQIMFETPALVSTPTGEDGAIPRFSITGAFSETAQVFVEAVDYYRGSSRIETSFDAGVTWYPMVGAQIPVLDPLYLRLTNGLVRLTIAPDPAGNDRGIVTVEVYDGAAAAWESEHELKFRIGPTSANIIGEYFQPQVLRNSSELCIVRLRARRNDAGGIATLTNTQGFIDFALRRGANFISGTTNSRLAATQYVQIATAGACSTFTGGIELTSADSDSNKWTLTSPVSITQDTTNRLISSTSGQTFPFAVGLSGPSNIGGQGADLRDAYFLNVADRQRVVAQ